MVCQPGSGNRLRICLLFSIQYTNLVDGQTSRHRMTALAALCIASPDKNNGMGYMQFFLLRQCIHINVRCLVFYVDVSHEDLCRRAGRLYTANRCFSVHINSAMSWFMARKSCLDAGGDLLRVDDAEILGALTGYLRAGTRWWVDGVNQRWTWDDGK